MIASLQSGREGGGKPYPWPGNVPELQNVVGQALMNNTSAVLGPEALPDRQRLAA